MEGHKVLITGIASPMAGKLAARLETDDRVASVIGVDLREPVAELSRTEFVRADLRSPVLARLLASSRTDTVVHLSITASPGGAGGRDEMKELNVIGTMQLLGAAQHSPHLRKLVLKSTTAVYGSTYADPALFREDAAPVDARLSGYAKDAVDIEGYARAFGRRRDDVVLSILRFANFIGPTVESWLTRYLAFPVVPTVLGYDPRLQLCHEDDAVEVLHRSIVQDHPGTYNVAGPGVVYLSQAIRIAGKMAAPVALPFAGVLAIALRRAGVVDFSPEQLQLLQFGRVGDITRLREQLGYQPRYSTREALEDFLASRHLEALVDPDTAARWQRELHHLRTRSTGGGPVGEARR